MGARAQELRKEAVQRLETFTKSPQYADLLVGLIVQVTIEACGCCPVLFLSSTVILNATVAVAWLPALLCFLGGAPQQQQGAKSLGDNSISVRGREQDLAILEKAAVAATSRLDDGVSVTVDKVRTVPDSW